MLYSSSVTCTSQRRLHAPAALLESGINVAKQKGDPGVGDNGRAPPPSSLESRFAAGAHTPAVFFVPSPPGPSLKSPRSYFLLVLFLFISFFVSGEAHSRGGGGREAVKRREVSPGITKYTAGVFGWLVRRPVLPPVGCLSLSSFSLIKNNADFILPRPTNT